MTHAHRMHKVTVRPFSGPVSKYVNEVAHGGVCEQHTCTRGARLLWSIFERTARESERAAAGAHVDREALSLAAGTLADLVRQDVAGGAQ